MLSERQRPTKDKILAALSEHIDRMACNPHLGGELKLQAVGKRGKIEWMLIPFESQLDDF